MRAIYNRRVANARPPCNDTSLIEALFGLFGAISAGVNVAQEDRNHANAFVVCGSADPFGSSAGGKVFEPGRALISTYGGRLCNLGSLPENCGLRTGWSFDCFLRKVKAVQELEVQGAEASLDGGK